MNEAERDRAADEYKASIEARKTAPRLSKGEKNAIALSVAGAWLRYAQEKIAEGKNPVKLSVVARKEVLMRIDEHPIYKELNYYIPSSTVTKIANEAVAIAKEMLGPQTKRYRSVRLHFQNRQ